jgi:hypothetical protein
LINIIRSLEEYLSKKETEVKWTPLKSQIK